jgi:hypothetical protein
METRRQGREADLEGEDLGVGNGAPGVRDELGNTVVGALQHRSCLTRTELCSDRSEYAHGGEDLGQKPNGDVEAQTDGAVWKTTEESWNGSGDSPRRSRAGQKGRGNSGAAGVVDDVRAAGWEACTRAQRWSSSCVQCRHGKTHQQQNKNVSLDEQEPEAKRQIQ